MKMMMTMMTTTMMMATISLVGCSSGGVPEEARQEPVKKSPVERGKHLVATSGCHDCHTPWKIGPEGPAPDMTLAMSGHPAELKMPPMPKLEGPWLMVAAATNTAWGGPWGISFTANLTPDKETGTGAWTEQTFIGAIRNAKHMGVGRPLLPPMPAMWYAQMPDEDLAAIFAYLQTLPPVKNKVPEPVPPGQAQVSAK